MLTINGITVRLGGRTILDRASATITPGSRVGLIGRNGAGKSTLMKVIIGQIEADDGDIEMPKKTRLGYIAQDAPSGTATPFETVLAADKERKATAVANTRLAQIEKANQLIESIFTDINPRLAEIGRAHV